MATTVSQQVQQKLDEWKRNLLLGDGRGNNLLHFRASRASMLRFSGPDAAIAYDLLRRQKALTIPIPTDANEPLDLFDPTIVGDVADGQARLLTGPAVISVRKRRPDDQVEFDVDPKKLPSILYRLRLKAQTALNERGVNVLFAAFGQLEWTEADDSVEKLRSPLVLMPVELIREALNEPYKMRIINEETVVNPVLIERLRTDFEIDLAVESDDLPDLTLDEVIQRTRASVSRKRAWQVHPDAAYLGMFSFLKVSMYKELESCALVAAQSPIIRRLAGESVALPAPANLPAPHELDDKIPPNDSFNILDADSSQLEAITFAKAGGSLVIQGPPGTGKSQTIANIIAESLAANKTVLFVSEKMAALDVVHKRLAQVGLGDFCLEAHSHNANKREIVRQLGDGLARQETPSLNGRTEETLASLQTTRQRLNQYVRMLHVRDNPLGRSVYEIQGEVAVRDGAPLLPFPYSSAADLTAARIASLQEYLHDLIAHADVLRAGADHPWHGCTAPMFSFELRDNIAHHLGALCDYLFAIGDRAGWAAAALGIPAPTTLTDIGRLQALLQRSRETLLPIDTVLLGSSPPDLTWFVTALARPWAFDREQLRKGWRDRVVTALRGEPPAKASRPEEIDRARDSILRALEKIQTGVAQIRDDQDGLQALLGEEEPSTLDGARAVVALVELLLRNPRAERQWFGPGQQPQTSEFAREAAEHTRVGRQEGESVLAQFDAEIFDIATEMLGRFMTNYGGFLRFFRSDYRRDMATLRGIARSKRKFGYPDALSDLKSASRVAASQRWLQEHRGDLGELLGAHFAGERTDWDDVLSSLETTRAILLSRPGAALSERVIEFATRNGAAKARLEGLYRSLTTTQPEVLRQIGELTTLLPWSADRLVTLGLHDLETFATNLREELTGLRDAEVALRAFATSAPAIDVRSTLGGIKTELAFLGTLFSLDGIRIAEHPLAELSPAVLGQWVAIRLDRVDDLDAWIKYRDSIQRADFHGLGGLLPVIQASDAPPETWIEGAMRHLYRLWLDKQYEKRSALKDFQGELHGGVVDRFRELDRAAVRLAARRVRDQLLARAPCLNGNPSEKSEPGILLREVGKRARHKPLRRLFGEIPTLLLALKPCLMMSPLSLSQYLDPGRIRFDIIIFDEASQIRPEDAVGAIMRGTQVIVAGDDRQLPPTSFFSTLGSDSGEEWDEEAPEVYESILDACLSAGVAAKMLRWHYRSRDEALIAFSNRFIYDGRLVTFPSAYQDDPDRGLNLVHVLNGVYDRSGTRTNMVEATRVVDLVMEHAATWVEQRHNRSLGVVAFSEAQQLAILQILDKRRRERPDLEAFFAERSDGDEFFVKNLENVQGDERDVIFFSIGYGRDSSGRISMNFGPLNRAGGERRLNVAITRARDHVKVVSSITGADIDVAKTKAEGVKLLKLYLDYAEKGASVLAQGQQAVVGDYESPFESAVAQALQRKGLKVQPQVGCAGFRIDLGIVDPEKPGRYVLGVECDGATYHRQATARDRDRLRQQVLEGLGWRIHRIWSRDWVRAPAREIEKVVDAYQRALTTEVLHRPVPEAREQVRTVPAREEATTPNPVASEPPRLIALVKPVPQAAPYRAVSLSWRGPKEQFYEMPVASFVDPIARCVREEGPVPIQVVRQRVAACWSIERVGPTVAMRLDEGITRALKGGVVSRKGEYLWPPNMTTPPVRSSGDGPDYRSISNVCPEEIDAAILVVLENDFASVREELVVATARLLGYDRAKRQVSESIAERIQALQQVGMLVGNGDQVSLPAERRTARS